MDISAVGSGQDVTCEYQLLQVVHPQSLRVEQQGGTHVLHSCAEGGRIKHTVLSTEICMLTLYTHAV